MTEHSEYTIDGTTYYVHGSSLYVAMDETHGHEDVDDHGVHLYDGRMVRMEWGGSVMSQVTAYPVGKYDRPRDHVRVENFEGATPLRRVVPDGSNECPECGAAAGDADEEVKCYQCGYGMDIDLEEAA